MYSTQNFRCPLLCLPFLVNDNEPFIEPVQTINVPEEAASKASTKTMSFVLICKVSYSRCKLYVVGLTFSFRYLLFTSECAP